MATATELRHAAEHLRRRAMHGGPRQEIHEYDAAADTLSREADRLVAVEGVRRHATKKGRGS